MGFGLLGALVERRPAAVVLLHELVYCHEWAGRLRACGWLGPIVGYFPVYGPVLSQLEVRALRVMDVRVALSRYGAHVVKDHGFPCIAVHLGVDARRFRPAPGPARQRIRESLGWDGRFVVAYVARNRWNKQQPKLLHAARILIDRGVRDVLVYLHCVPYLGHPHWVPGTGYVEQEHDLMGLRTDLGLAGVLCFPEDLRDQTEGIPEDRLVRLLQGSDCVAHVAHGEGFGLPLVEGLACGLPVVFTADGRVMSEIVARAGMAVVPQGELIDSVGNRFGEVTALQWADAILSMRRLLSDDSSRRVFRRRARRRALGFTWDDTACRLARVVRGALTAGDGWRSG
jgi:glycosyltransferase involved in cell wall biosynthesis